METSLFVPHAIVFLYDLNNEDVEVPDYVDDSLVAANEHCISIGTQSEVDGEVNLHLLNQVADADKDKYSKVFHGSVKTPSQEVAISTSEEEGILEAKVQSEVTTVSVWVDDPEFPSLVLVEVI